MEWFSDNQMVVGLDPTAGAKISSGYQESNKPPLTAPGQTVRQVLDEPGRAAATAAEQIERTGNAIGEMSQEGQDARSMLGNILEGSRSGSLTGVEAVGELFDRGDLHFAVGAAALRGHRRFQPGS